MIEKKTSFIDCEYHREEYCTNPKRGDILALFYCLKSNCNYDTLKKWW